MIMLIVIHQFLINLEQAMMHSLHLASWCGAWMPHDPEHPLRAVRIVCNDWEIPGQNYPQ